VGRPPKCYRDILRGHVACVIAGCGGINDHFTGTILNQIQAAASLDIPVYLFSQGIGPLRNPALARAAASALRRARRICIRESAYSGPQLDRLGIDSSRVLLTGDDAISLAMPDRDVPVGNAVGVNLRIAGYAGIDNNTGAAFGSALPRAYDFVPVPISMHEDDLGQTCRAARIPIPSVRFERPADVIQQVRRCRVVVTASYHGAVFALSSGIPAVCIALSEYYAQKFGGLALMFNAVGCQLVSAPEDLPAAVETAWEIAPYVRESLLRAARRQADASAREWGRMRAELGLPRAEPASKGSSRAMLPETTKTSHP
jgi:colanic acid/amylovoran biosynthesis protein